MARICKCAVKKLQVTTNKKCVTYQLLLWNEMSLDLLAELETSHIWSSKAWWNVVATFLGHFLGQDDCHESQQEIASFPCSGLPMTVPLFGIKSYSGKCTGILTIRLYDRTAEAEYKSFNCLHRKSELIWQGNPVINYLPTSFS